MPIPAIGKKIIDKYPSLTKITAVIYNRILGKNSIRISGGNQITGLSSSYLKRARISVHGKDNSIDLGNTCYLEGLRIYIHGDNNRINLGTRIFADNLDIHIEDDHNTLTVGGHTSFNGYTHLALTEGKSITIGEDCMFAPNVTVRTGDSHSIIERVSNKRINEAKDVVIGEHVWLGSQTIILKGSIIQPHSIVGSGSIITKAFDEGFVAIAGNPAKIIKQEVDWKRERIREE